MCPGDSCLLSGRRNWGVNSLIAQDVGWLRPKANADGSGAPSFARSYREVERVRDRLAGSYYQPHVQLFAIKFVVLLHLARDRIEFDRRSPGTYSKTRRPGRLDSVDDDPLWTSVVQVEDGRESLALWVGAVVDEEIEVRPYVRPGNTPNEPREEGSQARKDEADPRSEMSQPPRNVHDLGRPSRHMP